MNPLEGNPVLTDQLLKDNLIVVLHISGGDTPLEARYNLLPGLPRKTVDVDGLENTGVGLRSLPYREGHCDVAVQYFGDTAAARLTLGPEWSVRPSRELRDKLTELLGSKNVRLLYTPSREIM